MGATNVPRIDLHGAIYPAQLSQPDDYGGATPLVRRTLGPETPPAHGAARCRQTAAGHSDCHPRAERVYARLGRRTCPSTGRLRLPASRLDGWVVGMVRIPLEEAVRMSHIRMFAPSMQTAGSSIQNVRMRGLTQAASRSPCSKHWMRTMYAVRIV